MGSSVFCVFEQKSAYELRSSDWSSDVCSCDLRAILRRVNEIKSEDSDIALRHVFNQCYPQHLGTEAEFRRISDRAQGLLRRHIPAGMPVKRLQLGSASCRERERQVRVDLGGTRVREREQNDRSTDKNHV